jgi:hypothetical protein
MNTTTDLEVHANGSNDNTVLRMEDRDLPDGEGGTISQRIPVPHVGAGYAPSLFPWPQDGE